MTFSRLAIETRRELTRGMGQGQIGEGRRERCIRVRLVDRRSIQLVARMQLEVPTSQ
jgi:hypothetical protein